MNPKGNKKKDFAKRQNHRHSPLQKEIWEGTIERLAWGGLGVSHLEDGRILLLESPLALFPQEVVRASIRHKSKHAEGEVISWVSPSPQRSSSKCAVAGICGGCSLQGAGEWHSDLKRSMVTDLFRRMLPNCGWSWMPAPPEALRQRIQLHWDGTSLGFHQRKKNIVVPISYCPTAVSAISESIPRLKEALEHNVLPPRPQRWELATGTPATEVFAIDEKQRIWGLEPDGWHRTEKPVVHNFYEPDSSFQRLRNHVIEHKPGGFFQVSAEWAMKVFYDVLTQWDVHGDTLYDLYGGVGLFSSIIGEKFYKCVLVESDSDSTLYAGRNFGWICANKHDCYELVQLDPSVGCVRLKCISSTVEDWMPNYLGNQNDVILLDPPRAGLTPEIINKLNNSKAGTLVLIGCDGATFCRDIKLLSQVWTINDIAVVDLFPMTAHVECIGLLQRP